MKVTNLINVRELKVLFAGLTVLILANIIDLSTGQPSPMISHFIFLGSDDNAAAWYSSLLLAITGLVAYQSFLYSSESKQQGSRSLLLFSGLLFFMSADEISRFHEMIGHWLAYNSNLSTQDFAQHADWVWIGGPVIIVIFILFLVLLNKVLTQISGVMPYLAAGLAMIVFGGVVLESTINFLTPGKDQWLWNLELIFEESLEMIGTLTICYGLLMWRDGFIKTRDLGGSGAK